MTPGEKPTPAVTVLMPVYNADRFVAQTVESVLAQSFRDFEFLIINDGSTDGSLGILQSYARRDDNDCPLRSLARQPLTDSRRGRQGTPRQVAIPGTWPPLSGRSQERPWQASLQTTIL